MRKRFLAGGLVLVVVATALVGITHRPGTARAAALTDSGSPICLKSNTLLCLYLTGDIRSPGTSITLETVQIPVQDAFEWYLASQGPVDSSTFPNCSECYTRYQGETIYKIEKTLAGGGHDGCMSAITPTGGGSVYAVWEDCSHDNTEWVESDTNYFTNVGLDNQLKGAWILSVLYSNGACNFNNGAGLYFESPGTSCNIQFA